MFSTVKCNDVNDDVDPFSHRTSPSTVYNGSVVPQASSFHKDDYCKNKSRVKRTVCLLFFHKNYISTLLPKHQINHRSDIL